MAKILIADDEEMDRVFLDEVLGPAGHKLYFAPDGKSALRSYLENEIDVVIADLVMPELGGLQLIEELTTKGPLRRHHRGHGGGSGAPGDGPEARRLRLPGEAPGSQRPLRGRGRRRPQAGADRGPLGLTGPTPLPPPLRPRGGDVEALPSATPRAIWRPTIRRLY